MSAKRSVRTVAGWFLAIFVCVVQSGCLGGGSTGTGLGNRVSASGVIQNADGTPAEGMVIHVETSTEDADVTSDATGHYEFEIHLPEGDSLNFMFENDEQNIHWTREISDLPPETESVTVSWQITDDHRVIPQDIVVLDVQGEALPTSALQ